eukprot:TRINITY_DN38568_c0_g1_i1.p1 TRINITY_DN38568_c0_g1~~TRINITY_DN38568_c0_g1_i1.p1  ORF type:complete len:391 (+),score=89.91 TRINITY_DN38568_c0_g1_i1:113-1174(+)
MPRAPELSAQASEGSAVDHKQTKRDAQPANFDLELDAAVAKARAAAEHQRSLRAAGAGAEAEASGRRGDSRERSRTPAARSSGNDTAKEAQATTTSSANHEGPYRAVIDGQETELLPEVQARLNSFKAIHLIFDDSFDTSALLALTTCSLKTQLRVLDAIEEERIYFKNARSPSGFLMSLCDKAKTGLLDVRGLGIADPWRSVLEKMVTPRPPPIELMAEEQWLQEKGSAPVRVVVKLTSGGSGANGPRPDAAVDLGLGVQSLAIRLAPARTIGDLKLRLAAAAGDAPAAVPPHKMRLREARLGFLRDDRSLAYYNLGNDSELQLSRRTRAGAVAGRKARRAREAEATSAPLS